MSLGEHAGRTQHLRCVRWFAAVVQQRNGFTAVVEIRSTIHSGSEPVGCRRYRVSGRSRRLRHRHGATGLFSITALATICSASFSLMGVEPFASPTIKKLRRRSSSRMSRFGQKHTGAHPPTPDDSVRSFFLLFSLQARHTKKYLLSLSGGYMLPRKNSNPQKPSGNSEISHRSSALQALSSVLDTCKGWATRRRRG